MKDINIYETLDNYKAGFMRSATATEAEAYQCKIAELKIQIALYNPDNIPDFIYKEQELAKVYRLRMEMTGGDVETNRGKARGVEAAVEHMRLCLLDSAPLIESSKKENQNFNFEEEKKKAEMQIEQALCDKIVWQNKDIVDKLLAENNQSLTVDLCSRFCVAVRGFFITGNVKDNDKGAISCRWNYDKKNRTAKPEFFANLPAKRITDAEKYSELCAADNKVIDLLRQLQAVDFYYIENDEAILKEWGD